MGCHRNVIIYRIENENGIGPYMDSDFANKWLDDAEEFYSSDNHPTPSAEGMRRTYEDFCGFASEGQLHRWFSNAELERLQNLGFKKVRYAVPEIFVQYGDMGKQVLFKRKEATLLC